MNPDIAQDTDLTLEEDEAFEELERRLQKQHLQQTPADARQVGGEHYKKMGVQVWDVVDTWTYEQKVGYYRGNALKYIMRCGTKDEQVQEIKKAAHYLEKLTEVLQESDAKAK